MFSNKIQKRSGIGGEWRWGGTRSSGNGNWNQDILCEEKNMFSKKKKISNESKLNETEDAYMTTPEG